MLSDYYAEKQTEHSKMKVDLVCTMCLLFAGLVLQLQKHLWEFHSDSRPYECDQCSSVFLLFHDLRTHITNVHQQNHFSCLKCAFSTSTQCKMWKYAGVHAHQKYKCSSCPVCLSSCEALQEHLKHPTDDKVYPCMQCGKQFGSLLACQIHIRGKYGIGYHCVKCNR